MHLLGRRNFLSSMGLATGGILLPTIFEKNLLPAAMGAAGVRKRLFLVTNGCGILTKHTTCVARSEADFDLNPVLEPLSAYKDRLVIAGRLYNPHDRALHGNQWATLSVMPSPNQTGEKRGPPGGISIDRFLASKIGVSDPFPSIAQGIAEGSKILNVSCDGLSKPFPAIGSPVKAFEAYFGTAAAPAGAAVDATKILAQDKSILDLVQGDIGRMKTRLAGPEKEKLDQYSTSLRGIERQLQGLAGARDKCTSAEKPAADVSSSGLSPKVVAAHINVAAAAQVCGLTRIAHMSILGMEGPHNSYGWLGDTVGHHNQHHNNNVEMLKKIDQFVLGSVAQACDALAKVQEPGGTMLDNSMVAYINTCGGQHHGGQDTHTVITIGKVGGAMKTGRFLDFPLKKHCISDLFVSWANAFDVPISSFGDPMHCKGPLPGYLG